MNKAYIILAYTSLFALSLLDNGRGPAYPDILKDFAIDATKGSLIFSLASFSGLAINLTSGIWFKSLGAIKATYLSLISLALGGAAYYFSGEMNSFTVLMIASVLLGIGLSLCTITMNILVARGSNDQNRRQLFAGLHSVYGVTSFIAPYLLNGFILLSMGWKEYFLVSALIVILVLLFNILKKPLDLHIDNYRESSFKASKRDIFLFGIFFGMYVSSELIISSRLSLIMETVYSYSKLDSAKALSLFFIFLAGGRLFFSFVKIPFKAVNLLKISIIGSLILLGLGVYIHPLFLSGLGITMSYFFPVALEFLSSIFQENTDKMTTYIMTAISISLSINHYLFGVISGHFGTLSGLWLVLIFQVLCFILLFIMKGPQKVGQ